MKKPDYWLKSLVLQCGLHKKINAIDRDYYNYAVNGVIPEVDREGQFVALVNEYGYQFINEARKINQASYKCVDRLKERIKRYLEMGQCIWLTLTFSQDVMANTSVETRRKYVQRYLKSQSDYYLANIDFGKNTQREHYHAIVVSDNLDIKQWIYGFTWTERIKNHIDSDKKLAKYVSKLTNHAIKETTKRQCYIYSRYK